MATYPVDGGGKMEDTPRTYIPQQPAQNYGGYNNNDDSDESSNINIMEWVMLFLHNWYYFVACIILALSFAYLKNRTWQPQYYSEAKVIIQSSDQMGYSFMQGFGGGTDYTNINNQLLILGSYDMIRSTVKKLPFSVDMYMRGRFKTNSLYGREPIAFLNLQVSPIGYSNLVEEEAVEYKFTPGGDNSFRITFSDEVSKKNNPNFEIIGTYGQPIESPYFFATISKKYLEAENTSFYFTFRSVNSLEGEFASRLSLSYVGEQTSAIGLALTGNVANRDIDFLNTLCDEFILHDLDEKNMEASRTIDFINEQLSYLLDSLKSSELNIRQFKRQNKLVDMNSYTSELLSKLSSLEEQYNKMKLQEAYFKQLSDYLISSVDSEALMAPSSLGVPDDVLMELVSQYNELHQKRSDIGEANPNYEFYTRQMNDVKTTLKTVLANVKEVHNLEKAAFEKEYNKVHEQIQALPEQELAMLNYERLYKINDNYYTFLLQKQSEAKIRKASNVSDNKILQKARVQSITNGGVVEHNYMIFGAIGLLLPALILIVIELLNNTIRTEEEVLKMAGTGTIGDTFTIIGNIRHQERHTHTAAVRYPRSLFAEGFRLIRARVEMIVQRRKGIVISVSSAESGDGKTMFTSNLAGIYGMISKKVLLIDMDMRNPTLTKELGFDSKKGSINYLIDDESLDTLILHDERFNFDFLSVGSLPPNPSELIRSVKMENMLSELRNRYDYIVIDTSPIGLVGDAYGILHLTDVNLLAVRFAKSNKGFFKSFIKQVRKDNIPNVYFIFNDLPTGQNKGYHKGYGYYAGRYRSGSNYSSSKYYHVSHYYHDDEAETPAVDRKNEDVVKK